MPELNAIGIVASDVARSIAFYRLLGVDDFQEDGEGHIEATFPSGTRFMLDTEEVVQSYRPDWKRETGNQLALAFECSSPAEVDELPHPEPEPRASMPRTSRGMRSGVSAMRSCATRTVFPSTCSRRFPRCSRPS